MGLFNRKKKDKEKKKREDLIIEHQELEDLIVEKKAEIHEATKEIEQGFLNVNCPNCLARVPIRDQGIQRPTCPKCHAIFKVRLNHPKEVERGTFVLEDYLAEEEKLDKKIVKPHIEVHGVTGWAFEDWPRSKCTIEQLFQRIEIGQTHGSKSADFMLGDLTEIVKRVLNSKEKDRSGMYV